MTQLFDGRKSSSYGGQVTRGSDQVYGTPPIPPEITDIADPKHPGETMIQLQSNNINNYIDNRLRVHCHDGNLGFGQVGYYAWESEIPPDSTNNGVGRGTSMCEWFGPGWDGVAPLHWSMEADAHSMGLHIMYRELPQQETAGGFNVDNNPYRQKWWPIDIPKGTRLQCILYVKVSTGPAVANGEFQMWYRVLGSSTWINLTAQPFYYINSTGGLATGGTNQYSATGLFRNFATAAVNTAPEGIRFLVNDYRDPTSSAEYLKHYQARTAIFTSLAEAQAWHGGGVVTPGLPTAPGQPRLSRPVEVVNNKPVIPLTADAATGLIAGDGYFLVRNGVRVNDAPNPSPDFVDNSTSLAYGTEYKYQEFAGRLPDRVGPSSPIFSVIAQPPADTIAPAPPARPEQTQVTSTKVVIAWTANTESDFAHYILERSLAETWTTLQSVLTSTAYTDNTVTAGASGQTYGYRLRAVDKAGNISDPGQALYVTVLPSTPTTPTGVTVTQPAERQNLVTWTAVAGAPGYEVRRDGAVIAQGIQGTSYLDDNLTPNDYVYQVAAGISPNISAPSAGVLGSAVGVIGLPSELLFVAYEGDTSLVKTTLQLTGRGQFVAVEDETWLSFQPSTGKLSNVPILVDVIVDPTGLLDADDKLEIVSFNVTPAETGPPVNTTRPSITGTPRVGVQLTGADGVFSGTITNTERKWQEGTGTTWADISGQTGTTFTPGSGQLGDQIRFAVRKQNSVGWSDWIYSDPTAVVGAALAAPSNTSLPSISGTPQQSTALTVTLGAWNDNGSPITLYAWKVQRTGTPVEQLTDGGFEAGTSSFGAVAATLTSSATLARTGTKSLRIAASSTASAVATAPNVTVSPGDVIDATAYARAGATVRLCGLQINWHKTDGTFISSTDLEWKNNSTTAWTQYTGKGVAPPLAGQARVWFIVQAPTAGEFHYVDDMTVGKRPWSDIAGASGSNATGAAGAYTAAAGDVSQYLRAVVTATNGQGSTTANGTPVGPVAAGGSSVILASYAMSFDGVDDKIVCSHAGSSEADPRWFAGVVYNNVASSYRGGSILRSVFSHPVDPWNIGKSMFFRDNGLVGFWDMAFGGLYIQSVPFDTWVLCVVTRATDASRTIRCWYCNLQTGVWATMAEWTGADNGYPASADILNNDMLIGAGFINDTSGFPGLIGLVGSGAAFLTDAQVKTLVTTTSGQAYVDPAAMLALPSNDHAWKTSGPTSDSLVAPFQDLRGSSHENQRIGALPYGAPGAVFPIKVN
jgi:hypothetical protein